VEVLQKILDAGGKLYQVGGCVRDSLMGIKPHDIDYCITGLKVEKVLELFPDAEITGKDFPVFRINGDEYALARSEKKNGVGYKGFEIYTSPDITIEEDLARRDLTINAMARDMETGKIIDPYGGQRDLKKGIIRATTKAFVEDPLRVYRAARFSAKYNFHIESDTLKMMHELKGELKTLPAERVFEETRKALNTDTPSRYFRSLAQAEVLDVHFKELNDLRGIPQPEKYHPEGDAFEHTMLVLDRMAKETKSEELRFSALVHDLGKATTPKEILPHHFGHDKRGPELVKSLCERIKAPKTWEKCGIAAAEYHMQGQRFMEMRPGKKVTFLESIEKTPLKADGIAKIIDVDTSHKAKTKYIKKYSEKMFSEINGKTVRINAKGPTFAEKLHEMRVQWMARMVRSETVLQCYKNN
jgi:tRNA nucleotidyltransferase (CCA-adding enzyme)